MADFTTLELIHLPEGFYHTLENANSMFEDAQILAEKEKYGIAASILILASEEAIKAVALARSFTLERINENDISALFKFHDIKLGQIKDFMSVSEVLKEFGTRLNYLKNSQIKGDEIDIEFIDNWFNNELNNRKGKLRKLLNWWKSANFQKLNGFYVDWNNNQWTLPQKVQRKTYLEVFNNTEKFIQTANLLNHPALFSKEFAKLVKTMDAILEKRLYKIYE